MSTQIKPLLSLSLIEAPPKFLQSLEDAGKFVKRLKETDPDIVNSTANRSGTDEERRALQAGLLYLGLTEPDPRRSACTDIVLTARDNLNYALSELTRLVAEAWPKMPQNVRSNLLSILAELIAIRGASVELLMLHLYRRMPNIASVLDIITPQYFVQTLIPHEMEQWIRWMLRNVHCVPPFPVRRYQEFFHVSLAHFSPGMQYLCAVVAVSAV
ncbi:unnamed protein product [Dibothriocephalus latus]|uniref:Integrator complex subunit 3 N-terminal domain-containing protein n=1 Tax=Dibothriocephalus latus TaxID=60516 RepID=A0A3P7LF10_DIBLA|nr:unnamed protein product [Dibothriocephalus latus]